MLLRGAASASVGVLGWARLSETGSYELTDIEVSSSVETRQFILLQTSTVLW